MPKETKASLAKQRAASYKNGTLLDPETIDKIFDGYTIPERMDSEEPKKEKDKLEE